ncbi:hypothetical protein B0I37DRAFT_376635, partial [Chaetomium sp. MPI-CAGE-AT-0009]
MPATVNTGRCTHSSVNPQWTQWNRANPTKKPLNPHMHKVECSCMAFVAQNAQQPDKKCTCNHDNKV